MVDRNEPNARAGLRLVGLNAVSPAGSVATSVLRFNTAPTPEGVPLVEWATVSTTPELGTIVRITKRGEYSVKLAFAAQGLGEAIAGFSLDAEPADLTAQPSWSQASLQARGSAITQTGAETQPILRASFEVSERIYVTQAMVNAGVGLVRFVAGQGGPPIDATRVVATECAVVIRRIADLPGS